MKSANGLARKASARRSGGWAALLLFLAAPALHAQSPDRAVVRNPARPVPGGLVARGFAPTISADPATSAFTSTASTTLAWSHTVGLGANRLLLVGVSINSGTTVSGITFGAQALTLVGAQNGQATQTRVEIWRLIAPNSGSATVTVTMSAAAVFGGGATSFADVDQGTPLGTFASAGNNTTTPSITLASAAGELVFDTVGARGDATTLTVGAGQTQQWNYATGSTPNDVIGGGSTEPGAASVTMSWTEGSAVGRSWAIGAVPIKPAGVPPTATFTPTFTFTFTPTATATPTDTATPTPTNTATATPTDTATPSPTRTFTASQTPTFTPSPTFTRTPTWTPSLSPTPTSTGTITPSNTPTDTATPTTTNTRSNTPTISPSVTATNTPTPTSTLTGSVTGTNTPTPTPSFTPTSTPTGSVTGTNTPSSTPTPTTTGAPPTSTPTTTPAGGTCDLSIQKSASPSPVQPGQTRTYTIVVTNAGPADAQAVSVNDPLPSGTTYISCSASQGSCAYGSGTVTASLGTIPNGGSATVSIAVTVLVPSGVIANTATVETTTPDSNPDNDSDTRVVVGGSTIPTLSPGMMALLAVLLAALGVLALRRVPS